MRKRSLKRVVRKLMGRDPRECEEVRALMSDTVDAELDEGSTTRIEEHVGFCAGCRRVLGNLQETLRRVGLLTGTVPEAAPDADKVAERIAGSWRDRS